MENAQNIDTLFDRFLNRTCTQEELQQLFAHFQTSDETILRTLIQAQIGKADSEIDELTPAQQQKVKQVHDDLKAQLFNPKPTRSLFSRMLPYAAAVLLFLSLGIYYWTSNIESEANTITITANEAKAQQVELPDGSHVWLNAGATLTYPEKFSKDKRSITLSDGQAYFDIAKDENKPFTVHAGTLKVEVLGTSFEITAYDNKEQASVAVKSGTVNVSAEHTPSTTGTTLIANQKATLNTKTGTIETTEIDGDDIAGWKENRLVFTGDDYATVLEAVQRKYNVTIELQKPELLKEKLTLRLDDQPMQTAIKILSLSSNFNYEFANDSTIIIR